MAAYLPRRAMQAFSQRSAEGKSGLPGLGVLAGSPAPTADICDEGVFWKSPPGPRTMLSLKENGILSCATRPG
jgi:hypothetical protein